MERREKYRHYNTSKNHFDDFDIYKRDLSKMRLKREILNEEKEKLDHYRDMKISSETPCDRNVNYKIYKPIYNIYKNDYQEKVDEHNKQLDSYQRIIEYLDELLNSGSLSDTQLENTKKEQKEIIEAMDKVKEKIASITSIDESIK